MTATFVPDQDYPRVIDMCTALGVPDNDRGMFWRWADELPGDRAVDELNSYIDVLIAQRCRRPADDELSRLIALGLTDDEIRRRVVLLVTKPESFSRCRPSRA